MSKILVQLYDSALKMRGKWHKILPKILHINCYKHGNVLQFNKNYSKPKKNLLKLKKPKDIETEPKKSTLRYLFFTCKEIHN